MWWMMPAWVAWCWSGTGDDLHQDDDVVDDRSQDDLVDDGLIRRVAGGSAARVGGPSVVFCIDVQDDPVDDGRVGGVVRRRAHKVL